METGAGEGKSPVRGAAVPEPLTPSTALHANEGGKPGGPPPKTTGPADTDSAEYREGTVKSPPGGE